MIAERRRLRVREFCTCCGRELSGGVHYLNRARVCRDCAQDWMPPDEPERASQMLGAVLMALSIVGWLLLLGLLLQ